MRKKIDQFIRWLFEKRPFRTSRVGEDAEAVSNVLAQVPTELAEQIRQAVNDLPAHSKERKAIGEAVISAIEAWQAHPSTAKNSIVFLCSPVSSVSRILSEGLKNIEETQIEFFPNVQILDWVKRPPDVLSIKQQIAEKLGTETDSPPAQLQKLAIVPNLNWCFLRSAKGLDGIDYLQDTIPQDSNQFWVFGSGIVGWEYLKSTLKFHAYCGNTVQLPALCGEDLQGWLSPIVDRFQIGFEESALHKRIHEANGAAIDLQKISQENAASTLSDLRTEISAAIRASARAIKRKLLPGPETKADHSSAQQDYFDRLADISEGIGSVALQLFVQSLRHETVQKEEDGEAINPIAGKEVENREGGKNSSGGEDIDEEMKNRLIATVPKLPTLPALSQSDLYLLYSLMLHDDMTISALAESLGDAPKIVNNQVQVLRNSGVIEQHEQTVKINAMHYPRLARELAKNNFIVEAS